MMLLRRTGLLAIARWLRKPSSAQDRLTAVVRPEVAQQLTDLYAPIPECRRGPSSESLLHLKLLRDGRRIGRRQPALTRDRHFGTAGALGIFGNEHHDGNDDGGEGHGRDTAPRHCGNGVASATVKLFNVASASCTGTPGSGAAGVITLPSTLTNPFSLELNQTYSAGICVVTSGATNVIIIVD